jgi:hypothetical protein
MTLPDLASIGSLLSGVAVLASLIYLNRQIRQNTKHSRALIQQGRSLGSSNYLLQQALDPSLTEVVVRGDEGDPTLDRMQGNRYMYATIAFFFLVEDLFYQHHDGLIDEERHEGTTNVLRLRFQSPGFRAAWILMRPQFGPVFTAFLDRLMDDTDAGSSVDIGTAWKGLLAAEPLAATR